MSLVDLEKRSGRGWAGLPWAWCLVLLLLCASWPGWAAELTAGGAAGRATGWLHSGEPAEVELTAGQVRTHSFHLEADRYLEVEVEQRGVDVVLELFSSEGEKLGSFDSPTQNRGSEVARLVTDRAGTYRLEVRTVYRQGEQGGYRIRLRVLRRATTRDRHLSAYHEVKTRLERLVRNDSSAEEWRLAPALYEAMIRHARAAGEQLAEARAWAGLAASYRTLGETLTALETARGALMLWRELADRGMEAFTHTFIAQIYTELGEIERASDYLHRAFELSEEAGNPRWRAYALELQAFVHGSRGEYEEALDSLERAWRIWRAEGLQDRQAATLVGIGRLHARQGRLEEALGFYRKALPLSGASGRSEAKTTTLLEMARAQAALGREGAAKLLRSRAFESLQRPDGELQRAFYLQFMPARIDEELGEVEAALGRYRRALALFEEMGDGRLAAESLYEIARLEADQGRLRPALAAIERATGLVEKHRSTVGGYRLGALYLASRHEYYELWIELLMRLSRAEPGMGHGARAFEIHERSRARSLLEALYQPRHVRDAPDPALARRRHDLQARLGSTISSRVEQLVGAGTEPARGGVELTDLLTEYGELQDRIRTPGREAGGENPPRPLTPEEVRARVLGTETVLFEYALGEARSFLWIVGPSSTAAFELPGRAVVETLARRVYRLLTARSRRVPFEAVDRYAARIAEADAEYPAAAAELSRMLLAPTLRLEGTAPTLASGLEARRLLVVGDGILEYLPFAALPMPDGSGKTLGFEVEVANAPSASVLAALRERPAGPPGRKTLAVLADPAFAAEGGSDSGWSSQALQSSAPSSRASHSPERGGSLGDPPLERSVRALGLSRLEALPGTRREARFLESLVPAGESLVALGADASRELVLSGALREFRLVHFATHALLNSRHPDLSGIVLSLVDREGRPRDGFLRLHDVYELELTADLVVLSACRTALGQEIRGEGLVGLTRGFLDAGAPAVVASLWSPDDSATAALMQSFYRGMFVDDLAPAAALRRAQIEIAGKREWRAPYYWAAFILRGDWLQGS